jgi:hypothetical protein
MGKLAFFGTSHTQGICNDFESELVPVSYVTFVGHLLNRPVKNLGLSGINNETMLAAITKSFREGILDDCDTIIIEPRLDYDYTSLPFDNMQNPPDINPADKLSDELDFAREFNTVGSVSTRPMLHTVESSMKKRLSFYNSPSLRSLQDNLYGTNKAGPKPSIDELNDIIEYLRLTSLYMNNTAFIRHRNLEFIQTVHEMCKLSGKKFYWMNYEVEHLDVRTIMKHITDEVVDVCLNPENSIRGELKKNKNYKDLLCGCKHLNGDAQIKIAELIVKGIKACENK